MNKSKSKSNKKQEHKIKFIMKLFVHADLYVNFICTILSLCRSSSSFLLKLNYLSYKVFYEIFNFFSFIVSPELHYFCLGQTCESPSTLGVFFLKIDVCNNIFRNVSQPIISILSTPPFSFCSLISSMELSL